MSLTSIASSIQISFARPEHDFEVGELLVRSFVESYAREMPEVVVDVARKKYLRDVAPKRIDTKLLVATIEDKLVGTVCLYPPDYVDNKSWIKDAYDLRQFRQPQARQSFLSADSKCAGCWKHIRGFSPLSFRLPRA